MFGHSTFSQEPFSAYFEASGATSNQAVSPIAASTVTRIKSAGKIATISCLSAVTLIRSSGKLVFPTSISVVSTLKGVSFTRLVLAVGAVLAIKSAAFLVTVVATTSTIILTPITRVFDVLAEAVSSITMVRSAGKIVSVAVSMLTSMLRSTHNFFFVDSEVMYVVPLEDQHLLLNSDDRELMVPAASAPADRDSEEREMTTINRRRP